MNLNEYKKLCILCDEILLSKQSTINTKSIPWLHVLNEHPTTLKKYSNIKNTTSFFDCFFIKYIFLFFRNLFIESKSVSTGFLNQSPKKYDVLIISHLVSEDHLNLKDDFYFGNLPIEIHKRDKKCLVLQINHTKLSYKEFSNRKVNKEFQRIIFPSKISLLKELKMFFETLKVSFYLRRGTSKAKSLFEKKFFQQAARAALSFESLSAIRFVNQLSMLLEHTQPKVIITTMEGHSWERLAYYYAKQILPNIKCVGYQHAILFPRQHSIKRQLKNNLDPDIIFTTGLHTKKILEESYKNHHKVKIECIGTHRRIIKNSEDDFTSKKNNPACLVLPDGNPLETMRICEFILDLSKKLPDINFIIRLHPLISIDYIQSRNSRFKKLSSNIKFSIKSNIHLDFALSIWALYRGSGSAIHAVLSGLRPIYLSLHDEMPIDPLFQIDNGKKIISNHNQASDVFNKDLLKSRNEFEEELRQIREYSEQYYKPLDIIKTLNLIEC